eukprot:scaffold145504_cov48-Prasinocladus_malaysianus.AAC.1
MSVRLGWSSLSLPELMPMSTGWSPVSTLQRHLVVSNGHALRVIQYLPADIAPSPAGEIGPEDCDPRKTEVRGWVRCVFVLAGAKGDIAVAADKGP